MITVVYSFPLQHNPAIIGTCLSGTSVTSMAASTSFSSTADLSVKEKKLVERDTKMRKREVKIEERACLKRQREDERVVKRAAKPGECHKYIVVKIDRNLLELAEGSEIVSRMLSMDVQYRATEQLIPCLVTYFRQEPLTGKEQNERESVIIVPIEDFLSQVYSQICGENTLSTNITNTLCNNCHRWKMNTGGSNVTIVVCGLDEYYRKQKNKNGKTFRQNVLGENEKHLYEKSKRSKKTCEDFFYDRVSRIDIETALVSVQIEQGINIRLLANPSKIADFIGQMAKSIGERPYKLNKVWSDFSWYAAGSSSNCVKIDKSGVGLLKLWQQQLRQFSNVGTETAQAIAKEYPSPQSLIQTYRTVPNRDAIKLLADIPVRRGVGVLATTRKVGIELSKKIFNFFTETNPDLCL